MANLSVSATRLSSKDISDLAQIIEINLQYYCAYNSPMEKDYLRAIKTVIGLGFTAAMVDDSLVAIYHSRLNTFLNYGDFKQYQGSLKYLSTAIAEMVDLSVQLFRYIGYPDYYNDFVAAARKMLDNIASNMEGKNMEVAHLLEIIARE